MAGKPQPDSEDEIEEFPIQMITDQFHTSLALLRANGFHPKDADEAMGIRISAQAIGKEKLRAAAARVEQYADIMFDYAEEEDEADD